LFCAEVAYSGGDRISAQEYKDGKETKQTHPRESNHLRYRKEDGLLLPDVLLNTLSETTGGSKELVPLLRTASLEKRNIV
jgi:hypothetical protein